MRISIIQTASVVGELGRRRDVISDDVIDSEDGRSCRHRNQQNKTADDVSHNQSYLVSQHITRSLSASLHVCMHGLWAVELSRSDHQFVVFVVTLWLQRTLDIGLQRDS